MAQGNFGYRKKVRKSEVWSHHGKRKSRVVVCVELNRELEKRKKRLITTMYATIQEAFAAAERGDA